MLKEIQHGLKLLKKESSLSRLRTALVITVTTKSSNNMLEIFPLRYFQNFVCLPIGIKNTSTGKRIAKFFDGKVNLIFVDSENKLHDCENLFDKINRIVMKSRIYPIKGNDFTSDSAFSIIFTILKNITRKKILVIGSGNIGSKLALKLIECGAEVFILNSTKSSTYKHADAINTIRPDECRSRVIPITKEKIPRNLDCIVGFTRGVAVVTEDIISNLKNGGLILDGGTGTISELGIKLAKLRNIKIMRLDIRVGFAYHANLILKTEEFIENVAGIKKIGKFNVVAGGIMGDKGDIIVDNIKKPTKIIGFSDGRGGLLNETSQTKNADMVMRLIK